MLNADRSEDRLVVSLRGIVVHGAITLIAVAGRRLNERRTP